MRTRDRISTIAAMSALAVAVFAIGGAPRWAVLALLAVSLVAAAPQLRSRRCPQGFSPLLVFLITMTGLTALQILPLPASLVALVNPVAAGLRTDALALLGEDASWLTLSMDPASTRTELAKLVAYSWLAWVVLRLAGEERERVRLLSAVAGVSALVGLTAIVHDLLDASSLFGLYTPEHAFPALLAPLLNPNHLASLMVLGALVAGGLALHERRAPPIRVMWILVTLLCVGVALATRSRGAVLALAAGTTILTVTLVIQGMARSRSRRIDVLRVMLPGIIIVLCTLVLVVYFGGTAVRDELASTQLSELEDQRSKYSAWRSAMTLVEEAPVFGMGRGAFESAFTRVHPGAGAVTFSHLENEYLQLVVDWGIVGAVAFGACIAFAIYKLRRRWRHGELRAIALGALAAVALHNAVDFGLELPGLAVPVIFVAATLFNVQLEERSSRRGRIVTRGGLWIGAALVGVLAALPGSRTLAEDHADFQREGDAEHARAALERHPLDYLAAAQVAHTTRDPKQRIQFLNHALRLHPTHPGLHRIAARLLAATGRRSQAALEYRLALTGASRFDMLLDEVVTTFPVATDAATALPADHPRWPSIVTTLVRANRDPVAIAYLWRIVDLGVITGPEPLRRLVELATKTKDLASAERAARALFAYDRSAAAAVALARLQLETKQLDAAVATLAPYADGVVTSPEHVTARSLLCDVHIAKPDWATARACLTAMLGVDGVTPSLRRTVHARLAAVEEALGNHERARFERALANERPPGQAN